MTGKDIRRIKTGLNAGLFARFGLVPDRHTFYTESVSPGGLPKGCILTALLVEAGVPLTEDAILDAGRPTGPSSTFAACMGPMSIRLGLDAGYCMGLYDGWSRGLLGRDLIGWSVDDAHFVGLLDGMETWEFCKGIWIY